MHTKTYRISDARVEAMSKLAVGILDVDDIWCKRKLEYQVDIINKLQDDGVELGFVYGINEVASKLVNFLILTINKHCLVV